MNQFYCEACSQKDFIGQQQLFSILVYSRKNIVMKLCTLVCMICILYFVGSVSAECAWLLWYKHSNTFSSPPHYKEFPWQIERSHTTLGACQNSLSNFVNSQADL